MPIASNPALRRVVRVLQRQSSPGWGPDYQPAMRATRSEAPAMSRASLLYSAQLGRTIHAHSTAEQGAVLLALYHNALFDLHEQQFLSPEPTLHPLQEHPLAGGRDLPAISGTLAIADRLALGSFHPKARCDVLDEFGQVDESNSYWMAGHWIGDLLLFMLDEDGGYCVFWDVKAKVGDHDKPGPRARPGRSSRATQRAQARFRIQQEYYAEAGIKTVCVAGAQIDEHVRNNLRALFCWSIHPPQMSARQRRALLGRLRVALHDGTPPLAVMTSFGGEEGLRFENCKRLFYQAIWRRDLRVDLFKPVVVDWPMRPETRDVLVEHADWFSR